MDRYLFAVSEDVFCCWEYDLHSRNERFLSSIDGEYFNYLAQLHLNQIESEDSQRAAIALRAAYHHGMETLFSLLGALAQAPGAVPAWLPKCDNKTLRKVVESMRAGSPMLTQIGLQPVSLQKLAVLVHQYCWPDDQPTGITGERFGHLWDRFAQDFLNPHHVAEYNSIKHGLRVSSGGFVLRVGLQQEKGVRAPEETMQTIGASPFGTSFYEVLPVIEASSAKHHFRIRRRSMNWRAEAMVQRLQLLGWSINNVVGGLRCLNGADPNTVLFSRPEDPALFDAAWDWSVGVHTSNFDSVIHQIDVDPVSRADLKQELLARAEGDATEG